MVLKNQNKMATKYRTTPISWSVNKESCAWTDGETDKFSGENADRFYYKEAILSCSVALKNGKNSRIFVFSKKRQKTDRYFQPISEWVTIEGIHDCTPGILTPAILELCEAILSENGIGIEISERKEPIGYAVCGVFYTDYNEANEAADYQPSMILEVYSEEDKITKLHQSEEIMEMYGE